MKVSFSELSLPQTGSLALCVGGDGSLCALGAQLDALTQGALTRAMKVEKFSGEAQSWLSIVAPAHTDLDRVILLGTGEASILDIENAGGVLAQKAESLALREVFVALADSEQAAHFAYGAQLGGYRFDKYRTLEALKARCVLETMTVATTDAEKAQQAYMPLDASAVGIALTRDLVWEPANVLTTEAFAELCQTLTPYGLEVEVIDSKQMAALGMGAMLGVGQGSMYETLMVVIKHNGGAQGQSPIAFLGKGVVFDSGGLSLKPNSSMNTMKEDMGGAGTVAGLMVTLAKRQAKVNAIGVLGLVENMPSDKAQRPSDVVTTMSGQTVEVMNTDAEGRLVLCDLLTYTQRTFKPRAMFDLATLTGAIITALGDEMSGIFSNHDELAAQVTRAGELEGELVWKMPLGDSFKRLLKSEIADMRNNGTKLGVGGSSVAAQFLHNFIENDTPWVHLDIAGTAWRSDNLPTKPKGATGFGLRLLDRLVKEQFED